MRVDLKALKYMAVHPYLPPADLTFEGDWTKLKMLILLNSSMVGLKQASASSLRLAVDQATKALDLHSDPIEAGTIHPMTRKMSPEERAKAYFRRGAARNILKDYDDAAKDLTAATKLVPQDAAIAAELQKVNAKRDEAKKKQQKAYSKMFG